MEGSVVDEAQPGGRSVASVVHQSAAPISGNSGTASTDDKAVGRHPRRFHSFRILVCLVLSFGIACLRSVVIRSPNHEARTAKKRVVKQVSAANATGDAEVVLGPPSIHAGGPNFIVLLTCSDGFFDMWLNWLAFFERLSLPNLPVHLFAEDDETFTRCEQLAANKSNATDLVCIARDTVFPQLKAEKSMGINGYKSLQYKVMMSQRPAIVQFELERGYDVIFSDVDVVWQKNPVPQFRSEYSLANIWAQVDPPLKNPRKLSHGINTNLCPGFMVYRSCPATIEFVGRWRGEIEGKERRNQGAFNYLVSKANETVIKALPEKLFVTGSTYFKEMSDDERANAVVVHYNGTSVHRFWHFFSQSR